MKMTKRLIAVVAMLTLVVGMFGNVASICSAKSVSTAYSVSPTKNGKVAIKNHESKQQSYSDIFGIPR